MQTLESCPPVFLTGFYPVTTGCRDGAGAAEGRSPGVKEAGASMERGQGQECRGARPSLLREGWSGKAPWGR